MRALLITFLFLLIQTSRAQHLTPEIVQSIVTLVQKEDFKVAFEKSSALIAASSNSNPDLKAQVVYMNIKAAAGMVIADQMSFEKFEKNTSSFIGQKLAMPPVVCVSRGKNPFNAMQFAVGEQGLRGMCNTTNKYFNILLFEYYSYSKSIDTSNYIGNDVINSGILESVRINPEHSKTWIANLQIKNASISKSPSVIFQTESPSSSVAFSTAGATYTFYKSSGGKLYTKKQVDSMVDEKNQRYRGIKTALEITSRQVERDTAFLTYSYAMKEIPGEIIYDSATEASRKKLSRYLGKPLPSFELLDINGNMVSWKNFKGKPMVINFWYTSCPPCITEMPELNKIQAEYKNSNVVFLGMTYEGREKVKSFLQKRQFNYRILLNAKAYISQFTDVYPVTIFINSDGIIKNFMFALPMLDEKLRQTEGRLFDTSEFRKYMIEIGQEEFK